MSADKEIIITGRVISELGQPIPDALVLASNPLLEKTVAARTDCNGRFIVNVDFRAFLITASAQDGTMMAHEWVSPGKTAFGAPLDLTLQVRPARRLVIGVRNAEDQPVPGAAVEVVSNLIALIRTTTDHAGQAIVLAPPDASLSYVLAMKDGIGFDYICFWEKNQARSDPYRLAPDYAGPIDLCLNGASVVKVRVVDDADRALPGVKVKPWFLMKPKKGHMANLTSISSCSRITDAEGVAEFRFIPADSQQTVIFRTQLKGYCAPTRCRWDPKSETAEVKTAMTPLVAVDGSVALSNGNPVADAVVHVGGQGLSLDRFRGKVTSDECGVFHIEVNPDQFYLFVAYKEREASSTHTRIIRKDGKFEPIRLVLKTATRVHGKLTVGPDNAPASDNVRLNFTVQDDAGYHELPPDQQFPQKTTGRRFIAPEIHEQVSSDSAGQFEFYAGSGKHTLVWWAGVGGPIQKDFQITDEKEIAIELHADELWTEPRMLRGRVVRKDQPEMGIMEANLTGKLTDHEPIRAPEGTTDAQGNFNFGLRSKSDFYLLAVAPNGMRGIILVNRSEDSVTIEVGPTASIRGRILDEQGQPLADAAIRYGIRKGQSHRTWAPGFDGEARTDRDGFFIAKDLVPGYEYSLMAVTQVDDIGRPHLLRLVGYTKPATPAMVELGDLKL
jgi:hypothetical protein